MKAQETSVEMKLGLVTRMLRGEPSDAIARETSVAESVLREWESRMLNVARRALSSDEERREEVAERLGDVLKKPRSRADQGYWDRLQRSRSWLIAAEDYADDLDISFICHWIALNALFGGLKGPVERKADTPPVRDRLRTLQLIPPDILAFARLVSRLDTASRIGGVLKEGVRLANAVIRDKWHLKGYWEQGTTVAVTEELARYFQDAKTARDTGRPDAYLAILLWRIGEIRHHVFHGAATYSVSKNRDSVRSALGLLRPILPCLLEVLYGEGRRGKDAWPRVPKPRAESHQNLDSLGSL